MKFFAKIRWVASILLVFFIVLITNIIDRDNFNRLSYSVTTMYEDRIVASDILFDMSGLIKVKQIAIITGDTLFMESQNDKLNIKLNNLIDNYSLTKLTEKEKLVFSQLQEEVQSLMQKEKSLKTVTVESVLQSITKIDQRLQDLSNIQIQEGKRQVFLSDKAKDTINLFTQGEIVFLIIMAILIQIIILYKPKE
ncbi:chemotaxis protein [bacterium]|nr:MAG: chemotaxis protein [bacterium]